MCNAHFVKVVTEIFILIPKKIIHFRLAYNNATIIIEVWAAQHKVIVASKLDNPLP